jgi:hypothetical protein
MMQIFIQTVHGRTITLDVDWLDSIAIVKRKIRDKGISTYEKRLNHAGRILENNRTLPEYNIYSLSTLYLLPCLIGVQACIFYTYHDRTEVLLQYHPESIARVEIAQLKFIIAAKEGIPSERQRLVYADGDECRLLNRELKDDDRIPRIRTPQTLSLSVLEPSSSPESVESDESESDYSASESDESDIDESDSDADGMDIEAILHQLGMREYSQAFAVQKVTAADLPLLRESDVTSLVPEIGPQRRLEAYIASLAAPNVNVAAGI